LFSNYHLKVRDRLRYHLPLIGHCRTDATFDIGNHRLAFGLGFVVLFDECLQFRQSLLHCSFDNVTYFLLVDACIYFIADDVKLVLHVCKCLLQGVAALTVTIAGAEAPTVY
jgi:hypothetical protein